MNVFLYIVGGFAWAGSALLLLTAFVTWSERPAVAAATLDRAAVVFLIGLLAVALGAIVGLLKKISANGERRSPAATPAPASSGEPTSWPE